MAGQYVYSVSMVSTSLSASATKSLWLLDPVTNPITIVEWGVSFDQSSSSTAIEVDLYVVTSIGAPAGTSTTPVKWLDQNSPVATTTALTALSAEPTTVSILASYFIQPFGGTWTVQYPLQREPGTAAGATTNRVGLRVVTPVGVTPHALSYVVFEEG